MSAEEKFRLWKNRIQTAKKCVEDDSKEWEKYKDAYEGEILTSEMTDFSDHRTTVNLPYVDVRSSTPKLYSQSPYIYIDPETPESDLDAEIMEMVVNVQKDKAWFLKERMDQLVKECKLSGRGYLKTSYKFSSDKIGREYVGEEPNDEIIISFIQRDELLIPRDAKDFKSARWVAHKIREQIGVMRKRFKLKDTDKPTIIECDDLPEGMTPEEKEEFQYGTYFEIEDRVNHELSIIVDGVDRFVVKPYEMPYGFHSMYDALEWNQIPGRVDTKADFHFWWKNLCALIEAKNKRINHARKGNSKYIWTGTDPNAEQERDLKSYKDAQVVKLKAGQVVAAFQHAPLDPEIYASEQSERQDITVVSGMNEMKQGLPQTQKTAREAMAIVSESQDVLSYRVSRVEQVVESVIRKCLWLIQHNYDKTRVIGLTSMESVEFLSLKDKFKDRINGKADKPFLKFVGTEVKGEMRVRIKSGSSRPVDEDQRKADLTQYADLTTKTPQIASATDWREFAKEAAKVLHIENKGIVIDPKTPEQENVLLKRDIPVMPQINEPHADHIAKHELENNNTHAFLMHLMGHRLFEKFLGQNAMEPIAPTPGLTGPGGLSQENISGIPQGPQVPSGVPQAAAVSPMSQQGPQGLPN